MRGVFMTATGTGVGKTWLSVALTEACLQRGKKVVAIKPIETGADPDPRDALALADACGDPSLASASGLYRAQPPLAPYAVEKAGGPAVGSLEAMAQRVRELGADADFVIVEGAGGVLVPLDHQHSMADLMHHLDLPAVIVAHNALGVLSYTLTAVEALRKRRIPVRAIVLNELERPHADDPSRASNAAVLAELLPRLPILHAPRVQSPDGLAPTALRLLDVLEI